MIVGIGMGLIVWALYSTLVDTIKGNNNAPRLGNAKCPGSIYCFGGPGVVHNGPCHD